MQLVALFVGAYLLGAIPFGVLITRAKGIDIRKVGSGNIGATNVIRAVGPVLGILAFVLDVLKGLIPSVAAHWIAPGRQDIWFYAGMAAVVGHSLSPFLGFKGGKGISTALGTVLGSATYTAFSCFALFSIVLGTTRFMSVASIAAVLSANVFGVIYADSPATRIGFLLLTVLVIYRHIPNIKRLMSGTEPKFSFKKTIPDPVPSPVENEADPPVEKEADLPQTTGVSTAHNEGEKTV